MVEIILPKTSLWLLHRKQKRQEFYFNFKPVVKTKCNGCTGRDATLKIITTHHHVAIKS
ncbi:hypothetical protein HOLleu_28202 [Holothuria leucospilota]|uniref:Uncharacterized protein n=1 Tax=Holothuria leucospilota TaxID=206669 RepID=A0A9Q1BLX7_HOLLE|nr:hypothetical protein HOLleu_28202 [Holothuria leucospilota]